MHRTASLSCPLSGAGEPHLSPCALIVLPKSCSCRWGPCPPPPSLVWVCLFSFFLSFQGRDGRTARRHHTGISSHPAPPANSFSPEGCGVLWVVARLPDGVRRPLSPPDRVVGGPGRERADSAACEGCCVTVISFLSFFTSLGLSVFFLSFFYTIFTQRRGAGDGFLRKRKLRPLKRQKLRYLGRRRPSVEGRV